MKIKNIFKAILLSGAVILSSCSSDDPDPVACVVEAPMTYAFTHDGASTVSFSGQANRLAVAKDVYDLLNGNTTTDRATVDATIDNANSKLETKTAENVEDSNSRGNATFSRSTVTDDINAIIDTWCNVTSIEVEAGTSAGINQAGIGPAGYQLDPRGWEADQQYAKMLIGALCLEQVAWDYLTKMGDCADGETWCTDNTDRTSGYTQREHYYDEAFGYVYGMDADISTAAIEEISGNKYNFLGKYLSKHDGVGASGKNYRQEVYDAFKMGRQALVDGCQEELDRQIEIINSTLSKVVAWHAQDYLTSSGLMVADHSTGFFHYVSEAWGFVYSLQFMKIDGNPVFSHSEVMQMIETLDNPNGNGAWSLDKETLDQMAADINARVDF